MNSWKCSGHVLYASLHSVRPPTLTTTTMMMMMNSQAFPALKWKSFSNNNNKLLFINEFVFRDKKEIIPFEFLTILWSKLPWQLLEMEISISKKWSTTDYSCIFKLELNLFLNNLEKRCWIAAMKKTHITVIIIKNKNKNNNNNNNKLWNSWI